MALFPIFVDVAGRPVLVIGGGEVASRKIEALLQAGAQVRVHARALSPPLQALCEAGRIARLEGGLDPGWIDDAWLVVAATDDAALNHEVADAARLRRRWVNVVDDAALSTYHVPAIVDRSPLQVAISSAGAAPMLARRLRERLEAELDPTLGLLARWFATHRAEIRRRLPDLAQRRRWFEQALDGTLSARLATADPAAVDATLRASLAAAADERSQGSVVLLGCDAQDPGLLTLTALRRLNQADLLLVSAEVPAAVIALARRDAHRLPLPPPTEAPALLLAWAGAGERVVCLRVGGFDDADGHRLAAVIRAAGLACESVPCATAPASAG